MDVDEAIEDALIHYGRKGMKWGVITKAKGKVKTAQTKKQMDEGSEVLVTKGRRGKPKALGGKGRDIHEDAARATALRKVAKESGTHALSNKELQDVINRMELAGRYMQANAKTKGRGQKFVDELAQSIAKDLTKEIGKSASKGISNSAKKSGKKFSEAILAKQLKDAGMGMMWGE